MPESCKAQLYPAAPKSERDIPVFALRNRAALRTANKVIVGCKRFYDDVRRDFGATSE